MAITAEKWGDERETLAAPPRCDSRTFTAVSLRESRRGRQGRRCPADESSGAAPGPGTARRAAPAARSPHKTHGEIGIQEVRRVMKQLAI